MKLTSQETSHVSNHCDTGSFPTAQLMLLGLIRLAEPIALTSIFPYAYRIALDSNIGDKSNASFYAGLLIAAFALAESLTGMFWGSLSDRVGRKPVLLCGCFGTALSLLAIGFSTNFWLALIGRFAGGLLNGNIGVIQTMVGELVTRPEHEPRAYAIMPFVWSVGTIVGPSIGGYFSYPGENFPTAFPSGSLFDRFPYLLPNLVCAAMLMIAIIAGLFAIEETHPEMRGREAACSDTSPLLQTTEVGYDALGDSYGTFTSDGTQQATKSRCRSDAPSADAVTPPTIFTRQVVMLVAALGFFAYHSMTYDNLLPIFLQDERSGPDFSAQAGDDILSGGLGLSTQQVGIVMSINGAIALFVQGIVFPVAASWLGIWRLFIVVTVGHPIVYFIVPYLAFLPQTGTLYAGIYGALTVRNLFAITQYPLLLILLKEASPSPSHLGKINGLAAAVGAASRTLASPISGYLYGVGVRVDFTPLAWWVSALVASIGALQVALFVRRRKTPMRVREMTMPYRTEEYASCKAEDFEAIRIIIESRDGEFSEDELNSNIA